jgi:hypothetical protein
MVERGHLAPQEDGTLTIIADQQMAAQHAQSPLASKK